MKRTTILIAEDDVRSRNGLQQLLEPEGYDVIQAESGEQALALATAMQVDI
jgi:CheY-like chemotaxis protein